MRIGGVLYWILIIIYLLARRLWSDNNRFEKIVKSGI